MPVVVRGYVDTQVGDDDGSSCEFAMVVTDIETEFAGPPAADAEAPSEGDRPVTVTCEYAYPQVEDEGASSCTTSPEDQHSAPAPERCGFLSCCTATSTGVSVQ